MSPNVAELTIGERVEHGFYAVLEARSHQRRDGTPFMRARLRDATGILEAVAWDSFDACRASLMPGRVVKVRGAVGRAYNGDGLEIVIEKVRLATDAEYEPAAFVRRSIRDEADLVAELRALVKTIRPPLRDVVTAALEPDVARLAHWPAAEELHHAWLGGLLEHTLEVAKLCDAILGTIPGPDRDVAVAGALLHDVGKLDAYQVGTVFDATDEGRLFGHVLTGFHRVKVACEAVHAPDDVALHLLHIIASHHGSLDHGAAREPYTREAIVVHYADELSAQLMEAGEAIATRHDPAARWTERARGLKRDVFVGSLEVAHNPI
ncbi:MAG TPA: HD domain-containing protein [Chloroflexota bacterium]|nr:HD domain-containing protein [Chloroflexota bacterium]